MSCLSSLVWVPLGLALPSVICVIHKKREEGLAVDSDGRSQGAAAPQTVATIRLKDKVISVATSGVEES